MPPAQPPATTAVILARGLGTRMRRGDDAAVLDAAQARAAAAGLKAMIPDSAGRPFLEHVLASLADGGVTRVVLVVAPDHAAIADHFRDHPPTRVTLEFAVQAEPRGTADAVLAAESAVGDAPFLVLNADNLYPVEAIRALVGLDGPGLVVFARDALLANSNIPAERVRAFALVTVDDEGFMRDLVEKPDETRFAAASTDAWVSMNIWRFDRRVFAACRAVPVSGRGEHELPEAVAMAVRAGWRLRAVPSRAGVLDLSSRGDIASVAELLGGRQVQP